MVPMPGKRIAMLLMLPALLSPAFGFRPKGIRMSVDVNKPKQSCGPMRLLQLAGRVAPAVLLGASPVMATGLLPLQPQASEQVMAAQHIAMSKYGVAGSQSLLAVKIDGVMLGGKEAADLGLKELAKSGADPQAWKEAMDMLKDPAMKDAVKKMMKDPEFQAEVKKMMDTPEFKKAMSQAKNYVKKLDD